MRKLISPIVSVLAAVLLLTMAPTAAHAAPSTPTFGPAIDAYAAYDGQDTCDPNPKPGVVDFKDLLQQTYGSHSWGIYRDCSIGGQSEHKEGRALDYGFDVNDPTQRAQAENLLNWLLAPDQYGNPHAMARRLGLMYIIWNYQQWRAYSDPSSWRARSCDGTPSDCHTNHIHFSFSWAGALQQTTWWAARRADLSWGSGGRVATAVHTSGQVEVYAVTPSGGIVHRFESSPGGPWSNWFQFGPATGMVKSVAASRHASGQVEVYAVMSDGSIQIKFETAPGQPWLSLTRFFGRVRCGVHAARA